MEISHNFIHRNIQHGGSHNFTIVIIDPCSCRTEPAVFFIIRDIRWKIIISLSHLFCVALLKRITRSDLAGLCVYRTVHQINPVVGLHIHIADVDRIDIVCIIDLVKQLQRPLILRHLRNILIVFIIGFPLFLREICKIRNSAIVLADFPVNPQHFIPHCRYIFCIYRYCLCFGKIHRHGFVLSVNGTGIHLIADRCRRRHQKKCRKQGCQHRFQFQ